jgi:predicted nucleic acid-binding protein
MKNNSVCIDANFVVWLLSLQDLDNVYRQKWQEWQQNKYSIIAPTLLMYEVCNAFHRATIAKQITHDEAQNFLRQALTLGIQFYGDANLHQEALVLANLYSLPATYDAHYLALAQRLQIELWTSDKKLFNSVSQSLSWVKLI